MSGRVIVADDQPEVRGWVASILRKHGRDPVEVATAEEALQHVEAGDALSLIVLDLDFGAGRMNGLAALERIRALDKQTPVLILTGKGSVRDAVEALRQGATDFLEKDAHVQDTLAAALSRLARYESVVAENRWLREQLAGGRRIVGESPALRAVLDKVRRLGPVPRSVLIVGERGAGKELIAHALHECSPRAEGPFITVNCAAIPEGLLECELFGQEANAFDGAPFKVGRFDLADRGTLFLDEVGNMGAEFQRKVLRVIEYQSFERVQGTATISVDVRIVAATNADLRSAIADGGFRADLYDRLAFDVIEVPPLRERLEDVALLAAHFARRFHEEVAGVELLDFTPEALAAMRAYAWPGNIRELKNFVERLATRAEGPRVDAEHVRAVLPESSAFVSPTMDDPEPAASCDFAETVAAFERAVLQRAMTACDGNRRRAAEELRLSYDQLRRLLAKHGL